ncbi:Uncharacterized protein Nst1_194 [Candidatus Nanobsidianus stetteri]|uniref:Uncharacterized protein n=1 Tax=Nanobsidianus stetteri TaxID=1294122 RepID=R1G325_NANST|nr:Uncharacterized protein Nst1_194 [Candidatus Nanobsidianus stetteri]
MRLQSETIIALILLIVGALATIIIYNIIYPNLNIINPSGQEISRSLELNFQLLDYYIANNTLYAYIKPSEPVNYSQVFAIVNNRLVNVYPYNPNGSIVNPYNNGLLIIVANLSQIPPDQNGNYELEVGLENDIIGIFDIKYISNTLINYFQPPIAFNILNSSSNTSSNSTSSTPTCQASYLPLILYNTQSIPTPSPFQQDIAICNGSINIGNSFAYINNATLFSCINPNGQNIYFTTTYNSNPNIYSWYEGQLINGSTYCDVWWVNLSKGISSNSNITIYMYIGPNNANYYSQYYPYVGSPIQVLGTSQYDNGKYIFNYYQNFGNLSSLPSPWTYVYNNQGSVSFSTNYTIIPYSSSGNAGITTTLNFNIQNNILEIYASVPTSGGTSWDYIDLGAGAANTTNTYFIGGGGGLIAGGNNYGAAFSYNNIGTAGKFNLYVGNNNVGSTTYNYVPTIYEIGFSSSYTYFLVNYTQILSNTKIPGSFSLPITIAQQNSGNNIYLYWVLLRSLPPNDVMPSIYIG